MSASEKLIIRGAREHNLKKLVLLLVLLCPLCHLYANDAYYYIAGGQLIPTQQSDIEVEMVEEVISIVLESGYYEVTVDFFFYNQGETTELNVGFPFFCVGIGNGKISEFRCWTNNVETSYVDYPIEREWRKDTFLENAYVRSITFPSQKVTRTKISYTSEYGMNAPSYWIAKYLYGTGCCWKNAIGKMTVIIQNNCLYQDASIYMPLKGSFSRVNDNTWMAVYRKVVPDSYTDCISITLSNIWGDDGPRVLRKERYFACNRLLRKEELAGYTKAQLRLIRNAIYAFNGYPFKSPDLIQLFEVDLANDGWYPGREYPLDSNFSEDKLSDIEKANVKLILEEEQSR